MSMSLPASGGGLLPGLTLKAYASFDPQTYALINSNGFSSLAMGGFAYDYVFTFSTAMPNTNYQIAMPFPNMATGVNIGNFGYSFVSRVAGSFSLRTMNNGAPQQFNSGPLYLAVYA